MSPVTESHAVEYQCAFEKKTRLLCKCFIFKEGLCFSLNNTDLEIKRIRFCSKLHQEFG